MSEKTPKGSPSPSAKKWFNWAALLILGCYAALFFWSARAVFVLNEVSLYAEDGPLESLQAAVLAVSCLVFLLAAWRKDTGKLLVIFCALLCYSFLVRELDVERLNVPDAVKFIGSGVGRNATLVIGFAALLFGAVARFSYYKREGVAFLKSRSGLLLMLGGALLWVGDFFEKFHTVPHHVFFEEAFELMGYLMILLSALAINVATGRRNG